MNEYEAMMNNRLDLKAINANIQRIKAAAGALKDMGGSFPAVSQNADRILASVKMLELNITDVVEINRPDKPRGH